MHNGTLVVIRDYNMPSSEGKLRIVEKVDPPRAALGSIADVRTGFGLIRSPVSELLTVSCD